MPKAAPAASRSVQGGRGPRWAPGALAPSGRCRSAPRWTAAAAILFDNSLQETLQLQDVRQQGLNCKSSLVAKLLGDPEYAASFFRRAAKHQSSRLCELAATVVSSWSDKLRLAVSNPDIDLSVDQSKKHALLLLERLRVHTGPGPHILPAPPGDIPPAASTLDREGWLVEDPSGGAKIRPSPSGKSRHSRLLLSFGLHRLEGLPPTSIICVERAASRVREWRKRQRKSRIRNALPPVRLIRAIVHTERLPTAVGSPADHYWLVLQGRWASPTEVMNMFRVPGRALIRSLSSRGPLNARALVQCLGCALHPVDAIRAIDFALSKVALPIPFRYASACSGIDLFATALVARFVGVAFYDAAATEIQPKLAAELARIYAPRGLSRDRVFSDACSPEYAAAPHAHLWFGSFPCEPFSRRNHLRSEATYRAAAGVVDSMLAYARARRPPLIILENVDEVDGVAIISAALESLPGYAFARLSLAASSHGDMARSRSFWVAWHK